jgi:hypothetical protein
MSTLIPVDLLLLLLDDEKGTSTSSSLDTVLAPCSSRAPSSPRSWRA